MKDITKIEFEKYKCFNNLVTIENIKPINIIIGKNNIGKSSILDIIEMMNDAKIKWKNQETQIYLEKKLTDEDILTEFPKGAWNGTIGGDFYEFGKNFIGKDFRFCLKTEKRGYNDTITMKTDYSEDLHERIPN